MSTLPNSVFLKQKPVKSNSIEVFCYQFRKLYFWCSVYYFCNGFFFLVYFAVLSFIMTCECQTSIEVFYYQFRKLYFWSSVYYFCNGLFFLVLLCRSLIHHNMMNERSAKQMKTKSGNENKHDVYIYLHNLLNYFLFLFCLLFFHLFW